jgi:hypothetical protein
LKRSGKEEEKKKRERKRESWSGDSVLSGRLAGWRVIGQALREEKRNRRRGERQAALWPVF